MKLCMIAVCLLAVVSATELTAANYEETVINSDEVWMVEFSSKMCGSCKEFAPEWDALAKSLKRIKTAHVYIDDEEGQAIAGKLGVLDAGIPNVQLYVSGEARTLLAGEVKTSKFLRKKIAPFVKGLKKDDNGVFLKKGAKGAPAADLTPDANGIFELTDANWDDAISKHNYFVKFYAPWCSMCKKIAPYWDKIPSHQPAGSKVRIARLDATKEMTIANKYEIKSYPTLKVIGLSTGFTKEEIAVSFSLKKMKGDGQESSFLATWAEKKGADVDKAYATQLALEKFEREKKEGVEKEQEDEAKKNDENVVKRITGGNFKAIREQHTSSDDNQFFVKFYRPDCKTCQKLAPRFHAAAVHMRDVENKPAIVYGHVDCVVWDKVCKDEGIPSYPLMIRYTKDNMKGEWPGDIFEKSSTVKEMVDYTGGDQKTISAESLELDKELDVEIAEHEAKEAAKKAAGGDGDGGSDPASDEL